MKLLRNICFFAFIIVILLTLINFVQFLFRDSTEEYVQKEIGIDISFCTILKDKDNHDGFHGDGDYFLIANCESDKENILKQIKDWKELPLSKNLQKAVYGEEYYDDKMYYRFSSLCNGRIPEIEEGYYYFLDKSTEAIDIYSDKDFFNRYSYNFIIVLYDKNTNLFYYYELDT